MAGNIISIKPTTLTNVRKLATLNDLQTNNQDLIDLSIKIANDAIELMDDEDFVILFGLKKSITNKKI
jgi:hypothetical protein